MAKFKFNDKLYAAMADIHGRFRTHQSTIRQLGTSYSVGQETMRQFLIATMDDYQEVVAELRAMLYRQNHCELAAYQLRERIVAPSTPLTRRLDDFSEEDRKELQRRLEHRLMQPRVSYHEYVVDPLVGDL